MLDSAVLPERIEGTWEVGDGRPAGIAHWSGLWDMGDGQDGWLPAPQLRVLSGEVGLQASQAEGSPVCNAIGAHPANPLGDSAPRCSGAWA